MGNTRAGALYGLSAAVMWALYLTYLRRAVSTGLSPADVIALRYGIGAAVMLPWLLARGALRDLAGVGWRRGAALAVFAGPIFPLLASTGFQTVPLAHGAVIQPSSAVIVATLIAVAFIGERLGRAQVIGLGLVLTGIALIAVSGAPIPGAWQGQLYFVGAGAMWAVFTVLLRRWSVPGLAATAAINVVSALCFLPLYLTVMDSSGLAALPALDFAGLALVHGVLASVLAIAAYGRAVALLGVTRASLFPAIVPAVALVIGIPLVGEWPSGGEWVGAALASLGLSIAMGALRGLRRAPG
ncbi:MAG: DMT family transporter [Pseudomonadota bacterium]